MSTHVIARYAVVSVVRARSRYAVTHLTASGVKYSNQFGNYCLCTDTMPLKALCQYISSNWLLYLKPDAVR